MKKIYTILAFILLSVSVFAQAPERISYQAVVRTNDGILLANSQVQLFLLIRQASPTGTIVYSQTQTLTTNANGLLSTEIGIYSTFNTIDWSAGPYFLETNIDPLGGTHYTIKGTTQLLSVPYSLSSKTATTAATATTAEALTGGITAGDVSSLLARVAELEKAVDDINVLSHGFTDPRDNIHYEAVKIGNQIWMAKNLMYLPRVNVPGSGSEVSAFYYVYNYNSTNALLAKASVYYNTYGVLYNWQAAMSACPDGWRLPSEADWDELKNYLSPAGHPAGRLKEVGTEHWIEPNNYATDEFGFTALPGGIRNSEGGVFEDNGTYGYWWTSSVLGEPTPFAINRFLVNIAGSIYSANYSKANGYSVRCIKD